MKKEGLSFVRLLWLLMVVIFINSLYSFKVYASESSDPTTEKIVNSESFVERLREETIEELYGNREQYAKDHTGSRADYVDKEASKGGELVIDEARMQEVYDSKLQEFDAMVDEAKVDAIVKEKQEQLLESQAFKGVNDSHQTQTKEVMYWRSGGKYFGRAVIVFLIIFVIFFNRRKRR